MAALVKREPLLREIFSVLNVGNVAKYTSRPPKDRPPQKKPGPQIYHTQQKLESRGYLRPLKPYQPPENVEEQFESITFKYAKGLSPKSDIKEPLVKFQILAECYEAFQHSVPNSQLHRMNTIDDILEFYKTPVDTLTPLEHLKNKDLPPNLHVQLNPKRFDPEDPIFGGISAFPKDPTIVTDLRAKKKFKSTEAQNWTKDWREKALGYTKWEYRYY